MKFQLANTISTKIFILLFWMTALWLISQACSLTDNAIQSSSATPTSPVSIANSSDAIGIDETQNDLHTTSPDGSCIVSATVLHLRSCAGTDCPVDAWLLQGEILTILQPGTSWIKVSTTSGQNGWVNSTFCGGK